MTFRSWRAALPRRSKLNAARQNQRHRPGLEFPPSLSATFDPEALATADLIVVAVPSASLRANLTRLAPALLADAGAVSWLAVKGLEPDSCLRMSQLIEAFARAGADHGALRPQLRRRNRGRATGGQRGRR